MSENSNKVGRPSAYDPKYCQDILEYFGVKPYHDVGDKAVAADFPSFAGFAAKIGVHRDTLHEWCANHSEFSDAYKKAKELQENFILVNGHKSTINTTFAIFAAKNLINYRDKQPDEVDVVVNNNMSEKISEEEMKAKLEQFYQKMKEEKGEA